MAARKIKSKDPGSKPKRQRSWKKALNKAEKNFYERAWQERIAWRGRPRLHLAAFAEAWRFEQWIRELENAGENTAVEQNKLLNEEIEKRRTEKIKAATETLGWSEERLSTFKELAFTYREEPSAENYLRLRESFPEVEVQIAQFAGIDPLFALEDEFKKLGIEPANVAAALDGDEPSIDKLSLRLLTLLVARDKLPKSEPGYSQKRRETITDAMVDYLIVTMLEAFDWHEETFRVPGSLVVLIRHHICGTMPDLHAAYLLKEKRQNAAIRAGQLLKPGEKISVSKLAKLAGIPRSTAARYLAEKDFESFLDLGRRWRAERDAKSSPK
jgi:hypothetical protein